MFFNIYKSTKELTIKEYLSGFHLAKDKVNFLFNNHMIYVNSEVVKEDYLLKIDDEIYVDSSKYDEEEVTPVKCNLDILYEDNYILVVNKPRGILCYTDGDNSKITMASYIRYYFDECGIESKVRHIHRLDSDTTGCLVYAKDLLTHSALSYQMEERKVKKEYIALCKGIIKEPLEITLNIGKDRHTSGKMICQPKGLSSYTYVEPIEVRGKNTLVRCLIKTGRHHQIRVHLSTIGHPIIGDKLYDKNSINTTLKLHCFMMEFTHPVTHEKVCVNAPMPKDLL